MEALKVIPIIFSISTFKCSVDYINEIKLGSNYVPLNETVDVCAFIRNDSRHDEDIKTFVHLYVEECTNELTKKDCEPTIGELLTGFDRSIKNIFEEFYPEDKKLNPKNEQCVTEKLHEFKVQNNYIKYFSDLENLWIFIDDTTIFTESMKFPVKLARNLCTANETYSSQFEEFKSHMKKLSETEPCNIQYLINEGHVIGQLPEQPQNCDSKNKQFLKILNPSRLAQNFAFKKYFTLDSSTLMDCFISKAKQHKLFPRLIGIEFSHALQSHEFNADETKENFIQLLKSMDEFALECHAQI